MRQRELDSTSTELDARDRCDNHLTVRRRRTEAPSEEAVEERDSRRGFLFCCDVVRYRGKNGEPNGYARVELAWVRKKNSFFRKHSQNCDFLLNSPSTISTSKNI
jgi:hypothetical protein